jgi:hypothetical protein
VAVPSLLPVEAASSSLLLVAVPSSLPVEAASSLHLEAVPSSLHPLVVEASF